MSCRIIALDSLLSTWIALLAGLLFIHSTSIQNLILALGYKNAT